MMQHATEHPEKWLKSPFHILMWLSLTGFISCSRSHSLCLVFDSSIRFSSLNCHSCSSSWLSQLAPTGRMPCMCVQQSINATCAFQPSRGILPNRCGQNASVPTSAMPSNHQVPGWVFQQVAALRHFRSKRANLAAEAMVCQAQKQEEQETDTYDDSDINAAPGFLESEAAGLIFKVLLICLVGCGPLTVTPLVLKASAE